MLQLQEFELVTGNYPKTKEGDYERRQKENKREKKYRRKEI
jgi:hypothetical protein